MSNVLIVYGTKEGHTAAIAACMRETIVARGHTVLVEQTNSRPAAISENVDGVIIGSSIHAGKYAPGIREFVDANRERLDDLPSAFFQVCLAAADPSPESAAHAQAIIDELVGATGWHPSRIATFAGKLAWSQYDLFTRVLMKLVLRKQHLSPEELDTSHDTDYTDYEAVRRFAEDAADSIAGR